MDVASTQAPIWTEDLTVRSYDVDETRRMTSVALCRYFLEAAWSHAEALGIGFGALAAQGKFWVLSRLRIEVAEFPEWGSQAVLRTWPRGIKSAFALREFELRGRNEQRWAVGSSGWLVLDSVTRRPQRLHKLLPIFASFTGPVALTEELQKLEGNDVWERASQVDVRYSDIDVNRHVNSVRYLAWVMDVYPRGFHLAHSLAALEVNYLSETREGDELNVRARQIAPGLFRHSLFKSDGTEVCRARASWKAAGN